MGSLGRDDAQLLQATHLNTGCFAGEADKVGNDSVGGGEIDDKFGVFDVTIVV